VIYAIGEISGGHVNPAVTWATLMTGRLSIVRAFIYWICQMVGAIAGSAVLEDMGRPARRSIRGAHDPIVRSVPGRFEDRSGGSRL
jgi:glycerol uptake facilitator-like aquaporin